VSALSILHAQEKATSTAPAALPSPPQNSNHPFDYMGAKDAGFEDTSIFDSSLLCRLDQHKKQIGGGSS
jgi:hypothetical protein